MDSQARLDRRDFLRGRLRPAPPPLRPPWTSEASIAAHCLRCGDCARHCPETIIAPDTDGYPAVSFADGECTFCAACAEVCPAPVFADPTGTPWHLKLQLADGCLAVEGITCRSCGDACPERAIRFKPQLGGSARLQIDRDACTGCGACISVCPREVLSLIPDEESMEAVNDG